MKRLEKDQNGFSTVETILVLIIVALIGFIGWYVWHTNQKASDNLKPDKSITKTDKTKKTAPAPVDVTADWISYSSPSGKFTIKYPKTWVTATHPEWCADGIFMLGANSQSVGKCASEGLGQIAITWRTDRSICGGLGDDWNIESQETVPVAGVSATKITAIAKGAESLMGSVPEGTRTVQYCLVAPSGTTYIADYQQLDGYPDVLADFNTMVTKTFKLN